MGGFFGVVSQNTCVSDVFFGTDYHSHMGTVRGGMAFFAGNTFHRSIHNIQNAQFRARFERAAKRFSALSPNYGIGVISDQDDQPILVRSHLGMYALSLVGLITNLPELVEELIRERHAHFCELGKDGELNALELFAMLVNSQDTVEEGLQYAQSRVEGSASVLLLSDHGVLYAARDRFGRTPVILGTKPDGSVAVTMETAAFPNLGYTRERDLKAGEIVALSLEGARTVVEGREEQAICSFLYVYYGYPASTYEGVGVERVRYRSGAYLARRNPVEADHVAGIPDSGVAHALGYAFESGIRYARPFVKYTPTWPRSFMPPDPSLRQKIANMKLLPVPELIEGKKLIFCDDSIVRGTQLRNQVSRLYDAGAQSIHVRIACPPLLYKCKFLTFSRTQSVMDLATRRVIMETAGPTADIESFRDPDGAPYKAMVEEIRRRLGMTSLAFQRLEDVEKAIGIGKKICTYCWSGEDISLKGHGGCNGQCACCGDVCAMKGK
ncbi:MAG: amidophosphoribosyltransferase [Kiritimatiellia bacterium]